MNTTINTNIPSLVAQRVFARNNTELNESLARLSTGLRINSGKDDPAGLIASQLLKTENSAIATAIKNIGRANNVVGTAEGDLTEISNLITELESLVDSAANEAALSDDEVDANQLQIDAILESINRIAANSNFLGKKLLNGELDYNLSGVSASAFLDVSINSARLPENGYRSVVVDVIKSAELAQLGFAGSATGAGVTTLEIVGNLGSESLSFGSATTVADVATAINQSRELTGVSAVASAGGVTFYSTQFGSDQFVSVTTLAGSFSVTGGDAGDTKDFGEDAGVLVNGVAADVDGLHARVHTNVLDVELDLADAFGTALGSSNFEIVGGGADFMIGPEVSFNGAASLGIHAVSTGHLGTNRIGFISSLASGQSNSLSAKNFATAQRIIREASDQVATMRGSLGAFQKDTLETIQNSLTVTLENTTAALSVIQDADFAAETSNLTRSQILVQSATNTLQIANQQPNSILALLG